MPRRNNKGERIKDEGQNLNIKARQGKARRSERWKVKREFTSLSTPKQELSNATTTTASSSSLFVWTSHVGPMATFVWPPTKDLFLLFYFIFYQTNDPNLMDRSPVTRWTLNFFFFFKFISPLFSLVACSLSDTTQQVTSKKRSNILSFDCVAWLYDPFEREIQ